MFPFSPERQEWVHAHRIDVCLHGRNLLLLKLHIYYSLNLGKGTK